MADINIAQLIANFTASGLGALVAGYAGVWFAIARTKRERSFDQRLAWYRDILSSLHEVAEWADNVWEAETEEERTQLLDSSDSDLQEKQFEILVAAARAYATPEAIAALNKAAHKFHQLGDGPAPVSQEELKVFLADLLDALREASESLADEIRQHLGLERVQEGSWPFGPPTKQNGQHKE